MKGSLLHMTQQQNCDPDVYGSLLAWTKCLSFSSFQDLLCHSPTQPSGQDSCVAISQELSLGLWSALAHKGQDEALLPVSGSLFTHGFTSGFQHLCSC